MKALIVARRDLGAYFNSIYGYIIIALLLGVTGLLFNVWALTGALFGSGGGVESAKALEQFFQFGAFTTAITAWLLSFGSVAGEAERRTELVLMTSPISDGQVILGKFLAVMAMVVVYVGLTIHMPLMILLYGKVSLAQIGVGYLGLVLYGGVAASIGIFGSSLVRNQILAALLSLAALAVMILLWIVSTQSDGAFAQIAAYAAIYDKHYLPFAEGLLGYQHVFYFVSLIALFLVLATRSLERRRWR